MMTQDIRGTNMCRICEHLGMSHVAGFFCIVKGCQCGHHKDSVEHQMCCASCMPPGGMGRKTTDDEPRQEPERVEPRLIGFSAKNTSAFPSVAEFESLEEKDLP